MFWYGMAITALMVLAMLFSIADKDTCGGTKIVVFLVYVAIIGFTLTASLALK
jgi:FtsH-binding integral membrane protein